MSGIIVMWAICLGSRQRGVLLYNTGKTDGLPHIVERCSPKVWGFESPAFFQKIAIESVQFRRPRWHTRVQKLGKCPPGLPDS